MKSLYKKQLSATRLAVLDLCKVASSAYLITRVNVPVEFRGLGYGSELLRQVCEDADYVGVRLLLEINPYGNLNFEQLREWYGRYGFRVLRKGPFAGHYLRKPQ